MAKNKGKWYTLKDPQGREFQVTTTEELLRDYWFAEQKCKPVCDASKAVKNEISGTGRDKKGAGEDGSD